MVPQVYVAGRKLTETYGDLVISHEWTPTGVNGPASAQFSLLLKPAERPGWLVKGVLSEIRFGGLPLLAGSLTEPDWADGTMTIDGACREGSATACLTAGGVASSTPDTVLDAASSRGASTWIRPASISATALTDGDQPRSINSVSEMLSTYADASGARLYVDPWRRILKGADPTVPEVFIVPGAGELSWASEAQATRIIGGWFDAAGAPHVTTVGSGAVERIVNLANLGGIDSTRASNVLNQILARATSGGWTGGLTVSATQFAGRMHLASVAERVGRGLMVRLNGQRDPRPDRMPVNYTDIIIERSEWHVADGTITLTPRGMVARDWAAILAEVGVVEEAA